MATRSLNAEPLPALEALELERREQLALPRLRGLGSWAVGALLLDGAMLAAAAVAAQLGAGGAGIVGIPLVWLAVYGGLALMFLRLRGVVTWGPRVVLVGDGPAGVAPDPPAAVSLLPLP